MVQVQSISESQDILALKRKAALLYSTAEKHAVAGSLLASAEAAEQALTLLGSLGAEDKTGIAETLQLLISAQSQLAAVRQQEPSDVEHFAECELAQFIQARDKRGEALMLLCLAEIALVRHQRLGSEQLSTFKSLEKALEISRDLQDSRLEGSVLLSMSESHLACSSHQKAAEHASSAILLFQEFGDNLNEGKAMLVLGRASAANSKLAAACQNIEASINTFRETRARRFEAKALRWLSELRLSQGSIREALLAAEQMLAAVICLQSDQAEEAAALKVVAEPLFLLQKGRLAVSRTHEAILRYRSAGNRHALAIALEAHACSQLQIGKPEHALQTLKELHEVLDDDAKRSKANALKLEAAACMKLNRFEDAARSFEDAASVAEAAGDHLTQAVIHRAAADMYLQRGNQRQGLAAARSARDVSQRCLDKSGQAAALIQMSRAHEALADISQAFKEVFEARDLSQAIGDALGQACAYEVLANLQVADGNMQLAVEAAEDRLSLLQEIGNLEGEVDAKQQVATLHFQTGNLALAERTVKEAKALARKASYVAGEAQACVLLIRISLDRAGFSAHESSYRSCLELASRFGADAVSAAGKAGSRRLRGQALLWRGFASLYLGRASEAWRHGSEAASIFQELGDVAATARSFLLCGQVRSLTKELDSAKELLEQSLELAKECGEKDVETKALEALQGLKPKALPVAASVVEAPVVEASPEQVAAVVGPITPAPTTQQKGLDPVLVRTQLVRMVKDAIAGDGDDLEIDSPFMEAGMDSLSSVSLTSMLAKEFNMALSPSLVFDFPNIRALEEHLIEESKG